MFKDIVLEVNKKLLDFFSKSKYTLLFSGDLKHTVLIENTGKSFQLCRLRNFKKDTDEWEMDYDSTDINFMLSDLRMGLSMPPLSDINSYQFNDLSNLDKVKMMKGLSL